MRTSPPHRHSRDIIYFADLVTPNFGLVALGPGPDGKGHVRLLLSTDDGSTFRDIAPKIPRELAPDSLFALTRHDIWFTTASQAGAAEMLYRTTDGGRTWQHSAAPAHSENAGATSVPTFISPKTGWLAQIEPTAPDETIYRTTDGGAHWHPVANARGRMPFDLGPVQFEPSGRIGWLGGSVFSRRLEESTDGGRSWRKVAVRAGPQASFGAPAIFGRALVEPVCTVRQRGELLTLWISTDNGTRWEPRPPLRLGRVGDDTGRPLTTSFPSRRDGWAAGALAKSVVVYRTTDQGRHWTPLSLPALPKQASRYTPVISAADAERAWLTVAGPSTYGSSIYSTADGGRSWRRLTLP